MWARVLFWLVTAFFITMNVLLWRSETGGRSNLGSIPVQTVWQKMLIAPDSSHLEIRHHGKRIGFGTWTPKVGSGPSPAKELGEEEAPEGMIDEPSGYNIDFGSNFSLDNVTRLRFGFDLQLSTNQQWQEFTLHVSLRPSSWEVRASAGTGTVKFTSNDEFGPSEQVFKLSDLKKPDQFFKQTGLPLSPALLAALGLPRAPTQATPAALGLAWEARNDWLKIGSERMRVYSLQARLLDRFRILLLISLEGEILRVELPDDIVLVNDQLSIL